MKNLIKKIKQNSDYLLILGVIAGLIFAITYNISVHGIANGASFEF